MLQILGLYRGRPSRLLGKARCGKDQCQEEHQGQNLPDSHEHNSRLMERYADIRCASADYRDVLQMVSSRLLDAAFGKRSGGGSAVYDNYS